MVCKVTPKISSPNHRGVNELQRQDSIEVADYETALDTVGYGRLSRSALGACACAFFTTGVENCVMSYVLPAAKCELQLTTYQKGLINMAFMSGGVASAFFWGIVGDVFGRRNILSMTLILNGTLTLAQSTVTDYRVLLAARVFNGFLIGAPSTLVFSFLSDLVGAKKRQFYLDITGGSFVAAWLILPAIAWLVLPYKLHLSLVDIHSWRVYLGLGSVPAFIAGFWMLCLPDSPRLLADTNRSDQALEVLRMMYVANHGEEEGFKIKKLIQENIFVTKSTSGEQSRTKALFHGVLKDLRTFVSKAYAVKSTLILFVFFANMSAGFGINFWLPEILLRTQGRQCSTTIAAPSMFNATNTTWKQITQNALWKPVKVNETVDEQCYAEMDNEVFISGLIVGACCVFGNAVCALLCARGGTRGVRFASAACTLACALACTCLAACACTCSSANSVAVPAAAMLNAASLNGNVLLIRLLLHALPPKLGGLGVCWGAWWGRAGGMASNLAVGALLDFSCPAPFIAVATLLAASIGAIMMIKMDDETEVKLKRDKDETEVKKKRDEDEKTDEHDIAVKNNGLDRYFTTHM